MLKRIFLLPAMILLITQSVFALAPSFRVIDNIDTSQVPSASALTGAINLISTSETGFVQNNHTNEAPYPWQPSMNVAQIKVNVPGKSAYSNYIDYSQMAPSCLGLIPSSGTLEIIGKIIQTNGANHLVSLSCIKQPLN